jgi:alkylated DNA nucleotide flippase Atl1
MSDPSKTAVLERDTAAAPHIETLQEARGAAFPAGRMLISSPLELASVIERIPKGRVLRQADLRASVAKSHRADYACPVTTGLFVRILADATEEERGHGGTIMPYWRVVGDDGDLNELFPGGSSSQAKRLEKEGIGVFRLGHHLCIGDLEGAAWKAPPFGKKGR